MCADRVGRILDGWAQERPDLDPWTIGVWASIKQLDALLEQALAPRFAEYGLNGREFELLSALRRMGPPYEASPSALASGLVVPAATMTKRLDRLEQAGLLSRTLHPVDRRSFVIQLTDEGKRRTDQVVEAVVLATRALLAEVAERRTELDELLRLALRGVSAPDKMDS